MKAGEHGRMMEQAQSLASDPRAWYHMMQQHMRNHDEITRSGWLIHPDRTIEQKLEHWYAGSCLGFDTMNAADRYIRELETRAAVRTPPLDEWQKQLRVTREQWVLFTVVLVTQAALLALGGWLALMR